MGILTPCARCGHAHCVHLFNGHCTEAGCSCTAYVKPAVKRFWEAICHFLA